MLIKLGTAKCSEATPQCTDVWRNDNGDVVLSNHLNQSIKIPAGEWAQIVELLNQES